MGTIICQSCEEIIEFFEAEKTVVLYGVCQERCSCDSNQQEK